MCLEMPNLCTADKLVVTKFEILKVALEKWWVMVDFSFALLSDVLMTCVCVCFVTCYTWATHECKALTVGHQLQMWVACIQFVVVLFGICWVVSFKRCSSECMLEINIWEFVKCEQRLATWCCTFFPFCLGTRWNGREICLHNKSSRKKKGYSILFLQQTNFRLLCSSVCLQWIFFFFFFSHVCEYKCD